MPSINEIANIASALEKCPITIEKDSCVAVRNRNSSCRRCMEACFADALNVQFNEMNVDASACVGCGACVAACPTEAIALREQSDDVLNAGMAQVVAANDQIAVVACARISSKKLADPGRYVEVPCLSRLDETFLLEWMSNGAGTVILVDGNCATCKYGATSECVDRVVSTANNLVDAVEGEAVVERASEFPEWTRVEQSEGLYGSTRRGFFKDTVATVKETTLTAARVTVANELGMQEKEPEIGVRLRVGSGGTLPKIDVERRGRLLDALDSIGVPVQGARVDSRLFGSIDINKDVCNACGMCAVFCPTMALVRDEAKQAGDPVQYLEFQASDCIQCGLCVDVCWKRCITLTGDVSLDEIFDFEPRVFDMSGVNHPKKSPFGAF